MEDYRNTLSGTRRFNNPALYRKTVEFQKLLGDHGIAWHNPFSNECTVDFCCCVGDDELPGFPSYSIYFPSYEQVVKEFCEELFEVIRHGDQDHQDWLREKLESFRKGYFVGD